MCIAIHTERRQAAGFARHYGGLIEIRSLARSLLDVAALELFFLDPGQRGCLAVAIELVAAALLLRRLLH
jgi:hypothetical protein